MGLSQQLVKDSLKKSELAYVAESNLVSGIELNYDKFNISIGWKNPSNSVKQKGDTKYRNFNFNIGGNRWILENSYRSYKGFYNKNTSRYDTTFSRTGIYDQNPRIMSEAYKTKFLFFTNSNKFSFKSGYSCNYHQLKSAFSFVLSGNIYYNRINSDSSFSCTSKKLLRYTPIFKRIKCICFFSLWWWKFKFSFMETPLHELYFNYWSGRTMA